MTIAQAQSDMRKGYYSGGPGILTSAAAWSISAAIAFTLAPQTAILALLAGGMLIHPVSLLICKLLGAPATHTSGNPFGQLAGASTFWLIFCLPLAYGLGQRNPAWFFLAMLLIIGGRYLVFATIYGMRLYWALGLTLAAVSVALAMTSAPASVAVLAGAAIEAAFGLSCLAQHRNPR